MDRVYKKQLQLISLILLQLFFNVLLNSNQLAWNLFKIAFIFPEVTAILNFLLASITIYLLIQVIRLSNQEHRLMELERQSKYNEKLSTIIKSIRHDVANQVTIINSMYQLGKQEEGLAYARKILDEFDWIAKILDLKHPEIASLLVNKINEAHNHGIKTNIAIISDDEKINTYYSVQNITRILGNLIDNALYALKELDVEEKYINIKLVESPGLLKVEIANTGEIPGEIKTKIFEQGFTTKGEEGKGLGLYIIKTILESMKGNIYFVSQEGITKFIVEIPGKGLS